MVGHHGGPAATVAVPDVRIFLLENQRDGELVWSRIFEYRFALHMQQGKKGYEGFMDEVLRPRLARL